MPRILNCPKCSAPMSLGSDFEGEEFDCVDCGAPLKMRSGQILAAGKSGSRKKSSRRSRGSGAPSKGAMSGVVTLAIFVLVVVVRMAMRGHQANQRNAQEQQLDQASQQFDQMHADIRRSTEIAQNQHDQFFEETRRLHDRMSGNTWPSSTGTRNSGSTPSAPARPAVPEKPPRPTADRFPLSNVRIPLPVKIDPTQFESREKPGFKMYRFRIGELVANYRGPGDQTEMHLYVPDGEWKPKSLPCVLVPPAGTALIHGSNIGDLEESPEHVPYLALPAMVMTFTLDGDFDLERGSVPQLVAAYNQFRAAMAGLVNAKIAFECAKRVEAVDPLKIFIAGHSSAGTLALLFGEHEPLLAGVLAYAPQVDMMEQYRELRTQLNLSLFPQIETFCAQSSPFTHYRFLSCPTFLYHATGDQVTSAKLSSEFAAELGKSNRRMEYVAGSGRDHYQTMIDDGLPKGVGWLQSSVGNLSAPAGDRTKYTFEVRRFLVDETLARKEIEKTLQSIRSVAADSIEVDFAGNRISFVATGGDATRLEVIRQLAATEKTDPQSAAARKRAGRMRAEHKSIRPQRIRYKLSSVRISRSSPTTAYDARVRSPRSFSASFSNVVPGLSIVATPSSERQ